MDLAMVVLSIIFGGLLFNNILSRHQANKIEKEKKNDEIEKMLNQLSAERLKIKNDVDRAPLDELVSRKRPGSDE